MTTLSKEEYLKRYLDPVKSGDYKKKKKKVKEKTKQGRGMKIVDDDVAWSKLAPVEDDIPDELLLREEMPKIEEIDERTKEEKALDLFRKGDKWKIVDTERDGKAASNSNRILRRHDSDSDMDIPRKRRHDSSSESAEDAKSPKRVSMRKSGSDLEIKRSPLKRHDSSSDSMNGDVSTTSKKRDLTKSRNRNRHSDSRHTQRDSKRNRSVSPDLHRDTEQTFSHSQFKSEHRRYENSDSDLELPRACKRSSHRHKDGSDKNNEKLYSSSSKSKTTVRRQGSPDSDLELPRGKRHPGHRAAEVRRQQSSDSDLDLPRKNTTHDHKKVSSSAAGGLTSRQDLKRELQRNKEMVSEMDSLARESINEATVFRVKGGKKRDLQKEKMQKDAEDKEKEKKLKKYTQWGKGVTQTEMKDYALEDLIHEANKPLARYADDADLDAYQRSQMRDGDPMAEYFAKKRSKETGNAPTMPKYRGPAPAPNRYGIPPGYRWDGVDRSNGFEKKYFNSKSESSALKQEAYKWSVEDM